MLNKVLIATTIAMTLPAAATAADWEALAKAGYGVEEETRVDGEFEGCEYEKHIPLENNMTFICRTSGYSYAESPDVYILRHITNGDVKVVIEDEEYDGYIEH